MFLIFCLHCLLLYWLFLGEGFCLSYCNTTVIYIYCKMFVLQLTFFCLGLSLGYFKDKNITVFEFPILILLAT